MNSERKTRYKDLFDENGERKKLADMTPEQRAYYDEIVSMLPRYGWVTREDQTRERVELKAVYTFTYDGYHVDWIEADDDDGSYHSADEPVRRKRWPRDHPGFDHER